MQLVEKMVRLETRDERDDADSQLLRAKLEAGDRPDRPRKQDDLRKLEKSRHIMHSLFQLAEVLSREGNPESSRAALELLSVRDKLKPARDLFRKPFEEARGRRRFVPPPENEVTT